MITCNVVRRVLILITSNSGVSRISNLQGVFIIFCLYLPTIKIERLINLHYHNYYITLVCLDKPQTNYKSNYLLIISRSDTISMVIKLHE